MNLTTKRKNLTDNIREVLAEKILCGELPPGKPLASNAELAREFGVSLLTADRAVRRLVSEGLVYREQGRGTYVSRNLPERPKKALRIGIADKLAYPNESMQNIALAIRPRTAMQYLKKQGCEFRIFDYNEICDKQILQREAADLDGIFVSGAYLDPGTESNLAFLSIPVVITGNEWIMDIPFHQVVPDHLPGTRQAAAEVVRRKIPEILVVYENHQNGCIRRDCFLHALEQAGYDRARIRIIQVEEWALLNELPSYRLAMKLSGTIREKLLFSTSDVVSLVMLEAFRESGLQPGEDFQLLSFDNLEDCGDFPHDPLLTTIDSPNIRIAERASALLLNRIQHPLEETVVIRIPTRLIIRKTAFSEQSQ